MPTTLNEIYTMRNYQNLINFSQEIATCEYVERFKYLLIACNREHNNIQ